jgi:hypothetical protein
VSIRMTTEPNAPLRIGVVGFGAGGLHFHAPFIEAADGVELAGVVTQNPERRRILADRHHHRPGDPRQRSAGLPGRQPPRRAMYADLLLGPTMPPNFARYTFLDNSARRFYLNWDLAADTSVANLRTAAGKDPHDKRLHALVGELSTRSEEFRRRWRAHDVRIHGAGVKHFHHHVVGDLELAYEGLGLQCAGAVSDRATSILESDRDTNRPR